MPNQASLRLKQNSEKIMKKWEERANQEVLAALQQESLALRNSLPELLSQLSNALSTTIDHTSLRIRSDRSDSLRVGRKHGHERAGSSNYTMDQMIFEYHILREVIFDVMEAEAPFSPVEREVIICSIEQAVNDAATQFSETLRVIQERLVSTLTHDLRGPITTAKLNAELMIRHKNLDQETKLMASRISKGMGRLDLMIHDLLDAAIIRNGEHLPLKIEEFDLDVMIKDIAEELNVIHQNRFTVVSKAPAKGFWSESAIRRVVENLASNAVKYGAKDTPITISIGQMESKVTISVHNLGKSIPMEEQPILFQQFRRTQEAKAKVGWGLGLTVVKGITEAHHGSVRVTSTETAGTTFTVELPRDARSS